MKKIPTYLVNSWHCTHETIVFKIPIKLTNAETYRIAEKDERRYTTILKHWKKQTSKHRIYKGMMEIYKLPMKWKLQLRLTKGFTNQQRSFGVSREYLNLRIPLSKCNNEGRLQNFKYILMYIYKKFARLNLVFHRKYTR